MAIVICVIQYRYRVEGSLHTKLSLGDEIHVTIEETSVKSVSDFYVQVR